MARAIQTQVDSADFFVQARDSATPILTVTTTTTNNFGASPDQVNTLHKGAVLYLMITSLSAASTLGVSINGKEASTGQYITVARVSLDSVPAGAANYAMSVYPGAVDTGAASAVGQHAAGVPLPAVFQVVASNAAGSGNATFSAKIGMSKIL
jgi:hypothetical protein